MAAALPPEVTALLEAHAPHFAATPEGKVRCELNGHTLPARADALQAFIKCARWLAGGARGRGPCSCSALV